MPPPQPARTGSGRNGSAPSPDYFTQSQLNPMFNPFPSGTPPPPHPNRSPSVDQQQQQNGQYPGFHPYRRPVRQGSSSQSHPEGDWRPTNAPSPPYARPDASGSSSSVNSTHSQRQRTNSNQSGHSGHNTPPGGSIRSRNGSPAAPAASSPVSNPTIPATATTSTRSPSGSFSSTTSPTPPAAKIPHHRNSSSSSTASSTPVSSRSSGLSPTVSSPAVSPTAITPPTSASSSTTPRPARPSPLSQGNFTASEKRMSRDDSDLAAMMESTPSAGMLRSGGLKGRLRRALTFNQQLKEEEEEDDTSIKASALGSSSSSTKLKPKNPHLINTVVGKSNPGGGVPSPDVDDAESTATVQTKKKSRAASLFNSRLNASTDNISLSSTVSSASVMIRKLGSMGKLARRNSLAGITSLFKDKEKKNKEMDEEGGESSDKKGKKKNKSAKAEASEASVSHVTAELDRSSSTADWGGAEMSGLSPAAKLARQHTLKSNAEAAAKAKAQQEAAAAATNANANANANVAVKSNGSSPGAGVPTWEKNTHTRQGSASPIKGGGGFRLNEDGTRVLVEEEDDKSDDEHYNGSQSQHTADYNPDGWDDDEDWDGEEDEDVTIRLGMERVSMEEEYDEPEPWATDVRRSVERTRTPTKGILKCTCLLIYFCLLISYLFILSRRCHL